jgi:hypothetical protein
MYGSQPGVAQGRPSYPTGPAPYTLSGSNPGYGQPLTPSYPGASTFETGEVPSRDSAPKRSVLPAIAGGIFVLGLVVAGIAVLTRTRTEPTSTTATVPASTRSIAVEVVPPTSTIQLDDEPPVVGRLSRALANDNRPHTLRLTAPGFVPQTVTFLTASPPPSRVVLSPLPASAAAPSPVAAVPPAAAPLVAPVAAPAEPAPRGHHHGGRGGRGGHRRSEVGNL